MRIAIASIAGGVAALAAASMLGVAAAEAPTTNPTRTVSVEGVATVPIELTASASQANAAYRQGMAAAIADGQEKAGFLAGKAGAAAGAVQSIAERGGDVSCRSEGQYVEYAGEQPDFGYAQTTPVPLVAGATKPAARSLPRRRRARHPTAKKTAAPISCTLRTSVALSYALG
jgi:uncharacterized protein YggE